MSGWIKVTDSLPELGQRVLVTNGTAVLFGKLHETPVGRIWGTPIEVTHWQFIELPAKDKA